MIDEVVSEDELIQKAKDWVLSASPQELVKPWDQKGFKFPGGAPYHPSGFMSFVGASALVNGRRKVCISQRKHCFHQFMRVHSLTSIALLELRLVGLQKCIMTDTCTNMARTLFLNKSALKKAINDLLVRRNKFKQISVIGSGMMGSGIAYASILQGLEVLLIDQNIELQKPENKN